MKSLSELPHICVLSGSNRPPAPSFYPHTISNRSLVAETFSIRTLSEEPRLYQASYYWVCPDIFQPPYKRHRDARGLWVEGGFAQSLGCDYGDYVFTPCCGMSSNVCSVLQMGRFSIWRLRELDQIPKKSTLTLRALRGKNHVNNYSFLRTVETV